MTQPKTINACLSRSSTVGVGVIGASGYVGCEAVRILRRHPQATLLAVGSRSFAERPVSEAFPELDSIDLAFTAQEDPLWWKSQGVDVVFAALPHGAFASRARAFLDAGMRVIDLSADFRLHAEGAYPRFYNLAHPDEALLPQAVYGLTEWASDELANARLIANPGCYPTASLLGILPIAQAGLWSGGAIVINAMSGVTGAGRVAKLETHFVESSGDLGPYKVGEVHQHRGEIEETIARHTGVPSFSLVFNPVLVPTARGILAMISIPLTGPISQADAHGIYSECYGDAAFVRVLSGEKLPHTRYVRGSNRCDIAVRVVDGGRMLQVYSVIDNLLKGAAGQAVQNWNASEGWPEDLGLSRDAWTFV